MRSRRSDQSRRSRARLTEAFKNLGDRPKSDAATVPVSLRVPPDVLAAYKADGLAWQTRMNEALAASLRRRG